MAANVLDAEMLRKMFLSGAYNLDKNKVEINDLNVFPVPDGDTGTNMSLTILSAADAVKKVTEMTPEKVAKAISTGSLCGARGNSGVILSQIFRGFYKGIKGHDVLTVDVLTQGVVRAVETAYKAVMKPKEGTILTVAKAMADKAVELNSPSIEVGPFFEGILAASEETLNKTPDMLPVLKEAGVVDAGGMGLVTILKGAVAAYYGHEIEDTAAAEPVPEVVYRYKTEFTVLTDQYFTEDNRLSLNNVLEGIGNQVTLRVGEKSVDVFMKTDDPGIAIQEGIKYGQLMNVVVWNEGDMSTYPGYHDNRSQKTADVKLEETVPAELKEYAFIAVCAGDGLVDIFRKLGCDGIIEGGQTMNPSTDDIMKAIEKVHAETVYILPNNKNIILAANQAARLTKTCRCEVIPTKTIPQGITAVASYVPERSVEENVKAMTEESQNVQTGQITYSVRDTVIDGLTIKNGDLMGIADGRIACVGQNMMSVSLNLLNEMVTEDSELISLYAGAELNPVVMEEIKALVEEKYPDCDVEVNIGGQPVYYLILSVE